MGRDLPDKSLVTWHGDRELVSSRPRTVGRVGQDPDCDAIDAHRRSARAPVDMKTPEHRIEVCYYGHGPLQPDGYFLLPRHEPWRSDCDLVPARQNLAGTPTDARTGEMLQCDVAGVRPAAHFDRRRGWSLDDDPAV